MSQSSTLPSVPTPTEHQEPQLVEDTLSIDYPIVSILYCVKCKWMLRANWYQQELLQTFASKHDPTYTESNKLTLNSVILKPSLTAGTFKIYLKKSKDEDWILLWDRKTNGGFPDSKIIKQKIRDVVHPELKMKHLDKKNKNDGKLISSGASQDPVSGHSHAKRGSTASTQEIVQECLECKTWEY